LDGSGVDTNRAQSVEEDAVATDVKTRVEGRGSQLADYWPLISLIAVAGLAALAIATGYDRTDLAGLMHAYMGVFLLVFALLKLFNPVGFADGFEMYDLLAKRVRAYGYVYPYLELALGLAYLSFFMPTFTYIATIVLFAFGAVGVIMALRRGLDIDCPCMGSVLSVPLSTVTLTEDLGMIAMAAIMLLMA
jgi:hypothetical protein